ncbi:MAG: hypothetical protein HQK58_15560 [Deltaproteobacteria bacterium]|nr:hypothetical protein [Deltaproteobacteria bacterium]
MTEAKENQLQGVGQEPKDASRPKKWWQWLLVYPALLIAIAGSVPTYMEAIKSHDFGVPFGRSLDAQEQYDLFVANYECTQKATITPIKNKYNVEVASTVCESGDILLTVKRPEWSRPQRRWVPWSKVVPTVSKNARIALPDLFENAYAAESDNLLLAQAFPATVKCQRWVSQGRLLQRIQTPNGCFDQVTNTYTGWVESSHPAQCTPNC